ncbi:MAG: DNA polymerase domain-containing protein [Candidatus Thermoplasmatota archaeon]
MADMLLGVSPEFLYFHGKKPQKIAEVHKPYFLAFSTEHQPLDTVRKNLIHTWETQKQTHEKMEKIVGFGPCETYRSFCEYQKTRDVFKVYTKASYMVPEVSDFLFFDQNLCTAEHDIPYHQRVLVDLAAENKAWLFDTQGVPTKANIFIYDIEIVNYEEGKKDLPIDIIGYADFTITFASEKNLDREEFRFELMDLPKSWDEVEVSQLCAHSTDDEIQNLLKLCDLITSHDIISGHNITGFDNLHLIGRITKLAQTYADSISREEHQIFDDFLTKWSRFDKSFHFGVGSEVAHLYPCSFDTYLAARKFYPYLDDYSLKTIAPFLKVVIPNRIHLAPDHIKIDTKTLLYNKQDIQEQIGVTLHLLQQGLPLAFTTCMPFDLLLPAGAVTMWDHMALIRGHLEKKIMPPLCRVASIAETLLRDFRQCSTKQEIITEAKRKKEQLSKDFIRVLKYGDEMPDWVLYPYVIYNEAATDEEDVLGYHMPGGMTIKPDKDVNSHFIPWYHVVVADVGAMYPTILKAMNVGADSVRLAKKHETADEWIWLKKLPEKFFETQDVLWRKVASTERFADQGYMLGVKIDRKPGVVNRSMSGIMSMIGKIKKELQEEKKHGSTSSEVQRLKMMYQSMKGARNAGTHGILSAPTVTGRQFNLWGAAAITTKGQMILADILEYLNQRNIRVIYGDTDGIYLGCARSAGCIPAFAKALKVDVDADDSKWLTKPEVALAAIEACDAKWQQLLRYPDFDLEPEIHDAMLFVKHKNYLIFDMIKDKIEMVTKGNNFKGSDKADIARKVLEDIMIRVLQDVPEWDDEEKTREKVKNSIRLRTAEVVSTLDLSKVDLEDLTLIQSVQPAKRYKTNQDGSASVFGQRSAALEKLLGRQIRTRVKMKFVVTKKPLPGIEKPSKSGVKPIDYMYPVELIKDRKEIDLDWYKKMVENYVQGAFGLTTIQSTEQTGLDAWM